MASIIDPGSRERLKWALKQQAALEKYKKEDAQNPPKNLAHKIGRNIWRFLTFPIDPRIY